MTVRPRRAAASRQDVPVTATWSYLDSPRPLALAHRGAHGDGVTENSAAAFERAVRLGYRYIETDVHATADGVLLALHDPTLDRVSDGHGAVASLPYAVVSRARLADGSPVPLLEDLLGAWPDLRFNIDAKDDHAVGPLLDVLERTRAHHRVCIGAFSDRRIRSLRRALPPGTATALGPREVAALRLLPSGRHPRGWPPPDVPCVQVPVSVGRVTLVDEAFVRRAHEQGRQVHVWTIDDTEQMSRLLDLGVDGIVSDNATGLLDVIAQRRSQQRS
jgi:glycerophosphoryl diester phosphodiesterase